VLRRILRLLLVLWTGSLWAVAAWVTPVLFSLEANRHTAGLIAARLFTVQTLLGLAVALLAATCRAHARFRWLYAGAGILACNEWLLKPAMEMARTRGSALGLGFGALHGVSALLYLGVCAAMLILIWQDDLR
jgi:Domain of unknown function (DUF4149)